jgi:hypothetical protein
LQAGVVADFVDPHQQVPLDQGNDGCYQQPM